MMKRAEAPDKRSRIQIENRAAIQAAALRVFSVEGYRGATVERIASEAGMSKPNLLYYFPSKEDIYRHVLESTVEGWLEPFEEIDAGGDPMAELRRYILRKIEMSRSGPEASRLFANEIGRGAPLLGPFLRTRLRDLVAQKARIIEGWMAAGGLREVDPYHLIFMIWATTQHYADFEVQVSAVLGSETSREDVMARASETILTVILGGLAPDRDPV